MTIKKKNFLKVGLIGLVFSVCAVVGATNLVFRASAEGTEQVCAGTEYCLACDVATKINALPSPDEITIENAAEVTQQIHNIDRIKFNLETDEEIDEFYSRLTEVGEYGMPTRYQNAIEKLQEFKGFTQFVVSKKFDLKGETLQEDYETEASFAIYNVDTGKTTELTLFNLGLVQGAFYADSEMYQQTADGWTFSYAMPAGTYQISELYTDETFVINGKNVYMDCASTTFNGETVEGNGMRVTLQEGTTNSAVFLNTLPTYTYAVKDTENSPVAGVTLSYEYETGEGVQTWTGITRDDGFVYKDGESFPFEAESVEGVITLTLPDGTTAYCVPQTASVSVDGYIVDGELTNENGRTLARLTWDTADCVCTIALSLHEYTDTIFPPNCTEDGYTKHTCLCGYETTDTPVGARGHNFEIYVESYQENPCEDNRKDTYQCVRCSEREDREVLGTSIGHDYREYVYNGDGEFVDNGDGTCGATGTETSVCYHGCGKTDTREAQVVEPHEYSPWITTKEPTMEENGEQKKVCIQCGQIVVEQTPTLEKTPESKAPMVGGIVLGVILVMGIIAIVVTKNEWTE